MEFSILYIFYNWQDYYFQIYAHTVGTTAEKNILLYILDTYNFVLMNEKYISLFIIELQIKCQVSHSNFAKHLTYFVLMPTILGLLYLIPNIITRGINYFFVRVTAVWSNIEED